MPPVELLGNPSKMRYASGDARYARNPWSLVAFEGRVFIGAGNSNNKGPAANAGPVSLFAWDDKTSVMIDEYKVAEEQVDVLRALSVGGTSELWIPGHDATGGGWGSGSVYRRRPLGAGWEQLRTVPNAIHVYDIAAHKGKLFAAISNMLGGYVARSEDGGLSWKAMACAVLPFNRARALFPLGGELYASTSGPTGNGKLYRWNGGTGMAHMASADLFPALIAESLFVARPTPLGAGEDVAEVAYIAARPQLDHDWEPVGLFIIGTSLKAKRVALPGGVLPRDLAVIDGALHVLASTRAGQRVTSTVYRLRGTEPPTEVVRLERSTFARSFAVMGRDVYFGLGCDPDDLKDECGEILRIKDALAT